MKVTVTAQTGSIWEQVEVEVNEVNPRIALPLACHDAVQPMAQKCDVKPTTMLDRMTRRFIEALIGPRKEDEEGDDNGS